MPQDVLEFALSSRMTTRAGMKGESHHVWLEVLVLKVENKTSVYVCSSYDVGVVMTGLKAGV